MSQKIAIAAIHGIGVQADTHFADALMSNIQRAFALAFPNPSTAPVEDLIYQPILWADLLNPKETQLWHQVNNAGDWRLRYGSLRKFTVQFVADVVAYQPSKSRRQVYEAIHERVAEGLAQLAAKAGQTAPLCVAAHSLGSVIMHNFFFDRNYKSLGDNDSSLEQGETLTHFYTMGSPIALWSLRYQFADEYKPFQFPGGSVNNLYPQVKPTWVNLYDLDDVFAYPIHDVSPGHNKLHREGYLHDREIRVGSILSGWTPLAHTGYWEDKDVGNEIGQALAAMWKAVNG